MPPPNLTRRALLVALAAAAAGAAAREAGRYERVPRSADGIGKRYMGREIAGVMGSQGAAWLEREEREREERTDLLLRALALEPGMVIADIGAGTGYLSSRMAALVRPGGKVFAVDVQPEMVRMLRGMSQRLGLDNVHPSLAAEDDVRLPSASVDLAIMVDVYHELSQPYEVLDSIKRSLKPDGTIVFVEYKAEDPNVPIKPAHKMSEAQIRREAGASGLVWVKTIAELPWQHVVVFRKGSAAAAK